MAIFVKDPGATIDYAVDWAAGYLEGQDIVQSSWVITPGGDGAIAVASSRIAQTRTIATLSGGIAGLVYRLTNQIQLSDGRRDERTLVIRVEDR